MHVQAITDDVVEVEGVPPSRGYRQVYFAELADVCRLVPRPLAEELQAAADAHLARPRIQQLGAFCFKFWPAPSQAGMLGAALAAVRA